MLLQVENLNVYYGVIQAIKNVSFEVREGEIVSLIGANGAGKTTILQTLSGLIRAESGQIRYQGQEVSQASTVDIVKKGIVHVPEGRHVFSGMSVKENIELGAFSREDKVDFSKEVDRIFARFPVLEERLDQDAQTLSGGEQQMLAMARALMSRPKLLLLDEPSMGLAPIFIQEIFDIIQEINAEGTTILLIEQNAKKALEIADRGYILETGNLVTQGTGQELLNSDAVQKAYLGG